MFIYDKFEFWHNEIYIIPMIDNQHEIKFSKAHAKRKDIFIFICWNCWKLNSQIVNIGLLSQPLCYYYKYTTLDVFFILIPQLLKF